MFCFYKLFFESQKKKHCYLRFWKIKQDFQNRQLLGKSYCIFSKAFLWWIISENDVFLRLKESFIKTKFVFSLIFGDLSELFLFCLNQFFLTRCFFTMVYKMHSVILYMLSIFNSYSVFSYSANKTLLTLTIALKLK